MHREVVTIKEFKGLDKRNNEIWMNENNERVCSAVNCERIAEKRGYCGRHYRQIQRHGRLTPELEISLSSEIQGKCIVEKCEEQHYALGYCSKHRSQYKTHGKILDRTRFDSNEFIEYEDYYEMLLYDRYGNEIARTKISKCDYEELKQSKWCYSKSTGYVYGHIDNNKVALHRYITKANGDEVPDHYNRNKLDNRRDNLFVVDKFVNSWNSLKTGIEDYIKGVNYNNRDNVWRARLYCKKQLRLDESFIKKEDAVIARLKAEKQWFGEFAPQRHLFEKYNI